MGRLSAQWPSIADTDLGADDWIDTVVGLSFDQGQQVAESLLHGWTRDRPPRLADWQEAARQVAQRRQLEQSRVPAIESPTASKDAVAGLIGGIRDRLTTMDRRCRCVGCERRRSSAIR